MADPAYYISGGMRGRKPKGWPFDKRVEPYPGEAKALAHVQAEILEPMIDKLKAVLDGR